MLAAAYDSFSSPNSMALILSIAILVISAALLTSRIIGFLISSGLVFLLLASAFAIANNEIVSGWLDKNMTPQERVELDAKFQGIFSLPAIIEPLQRLFRTVVDTLSNRPTTSATPGVKPLGKRLEVQKNSLFGIVEHPTPSDHSLFEL